MIRAAKYIFMFTLASFLGWCYEVACVWVLFRYYCNRGILHLPLCPIYGVGLLVLLFIFRKVKSPIVLFGGSFLVTTAIEYIASYVLQWILGYVPWTYAGWPLSIRDRISAVSSMIFGLLAVLFICLIKPKVEKLFESKIKTEVAIAVYVILAGMILWEIRFLG